MDRTSTMRASVELSERGGSVSIDGTFHALRASNVDDARMEALELLRGQIFRSLIPRSPRVSATSRSGDLLSRATKDVDRIEVFFAHTFAPAVCAVVVPITVLTLIGLKVSWLVALAALPFVVLQLLIVPRLGFAASVDASRSVSAARAELTQHVTDTVQGMSEVVGYGRSQERLDEMARIDAEIAGAAGGEIAGAAVPTAGREA